MEPPSSVAEPKPQAETRAPQVQSPQPQSPQSQSLQTQPAPDSEARYQRRTAFLGHPRAKLGLILAGLVISGRGFLSMALSGEL